MNGQAAKVSSLEIAAETHLISSAGMINEAITLAGSGSVAVPGCGRCTEIPLRELNQKFDTVDLIDIDGAALDFVRAQYEQWNDRTDSFHFHRADLTGIVATVECRARELVANAVAPLECLEQLGVLLESTAPEFWSPRKVSVMIL